jgi:hypothetical protein
MKKLFLLTCILLSGCGAELISSSDKLIVVQAGRSDVDKAQDLAEAECLKRGLHARLTTRVSGNQYGFDCVR